MPMLIVSYDEQQTKSEALIAALLAADPQVQIALATNYLPVGATLSPTAAKNATDDLEERDPALLAKAKLYADVIRPTPEQYSRRKLLVDIANGHDTLSMSQGEAMLSPRGAVSGLARTLKKAFPGCVDHMDQLFVREKTYFPDGKYRATRYRPTELGFMVLAVLLKLDALTTEENRNESTQIPL